MPTFTKYRPKSEKELHIIIEKELDALEDGLKLLQYEFSTGSGVADFLCVDSGGRFVIIEVKLHEDENILFQALRYYSDVDKDRYLIASLFGGYKIDLEEDPRIILIAERFSDDIRRLSTLVLPEIELFEYSVLVGSGGEKGIYYHAISLPIAISGPSEPKTLDELVEYLTNDSLNPVLQKMRGDIKDLGTQIEEYPTRSYIGYKHNCGRQFAYIRINRRSLEFGAHDIDEDRRLLGYESVRVETGDEDYSEILGKINISYNNLGGD